MKTESVSHISPVHLCFKKISARLHNHKQGWSYSVGEALYLAFDEVVLKGFRK